MYTRSVPRPGVIAVVVQEVIEVYDVTTNSVAEI